MHKPEFVKRDCVIADAGYIQWLSDVKKRFRESQIRAINLCEEQGLPAPVFAEDFEFRSVIYRPEKQQTDVQESADRDKATGQVTGQATGQAAGQAAGQATAPIQRVVLAIGRDMKTRAELMEALKLKGRDNFRKTYLTPSVKAGFVKPLYPSVETHPEQAYYLSAEGLQLLKQLSKRNKV